MGILGRRRGQEKENEGKETRVEWRNGNKKRMKERKQEENEGKETRENKGKGSRVEWRKGNKKRMKEREVE